MNQMITFFIQIGLSIKFYPQLITAFYVVKWDRARSLDTQSAKGDKLDVAKIGGKAVFYKNSIDSFNNGAITIDLNLLRITV